MDESAFIREYMAVMCCSERSALDVFILQEALVEPLPPLWLDRLEHGPVQYLVEPSPGWS